MQKHSAEHVEACDDSRIIDKATSDVMSTVTNEHVQLSGEDDIRIRRKTDLRILTILVWVYFLQVLDKAVLGNAAVFGLQKDLGLKGNQYSLIGSIAPIAQLGWQPFSSYLIVRVPHRILLSSLLLGWGIALAASAAAHDFGSLLAARFFLGLFEAGALPLFSIITSHWYRRVEQPLRVAAWYSMNGASTIAASAISYGLGHIQSSVLKPWQIIFLFLGLFTVVCAPWVYWQLEDDIPSARFLTEQEKPLALERLRTNKTGTGSRVFNISQVWEIFLEPKSYLWVALAVLVNIGSSVTGTFGPIILAGFGFSPLHTSLLNMPFGAVQLIVILVSCWIALRAKVKSIILVAFMIPVITGLAMLYKLKRGREDQAALVVAYYLLAFLFAGNPILISWVVGNTAGTTKKSTIMAFYQAGTSSGNIIGPLLFNKKDAPVYLPGLRDVLAIFVTFVACIFIQLFNLLILNKLQRKKRVRNGKSADLTDFSMALHIQGVIEATEGSTMESAGEGEDELTDRQNDEFMYLY